MHGSSSVPQDLLAIIRENGGEMKETYGVPVEEIQEGIKHGVRKINIDTDIRLAMTAAVRKFLAANRSAFDPRDYLKPAREAAKQICKARYEQFGCAGMGSKIKPLAARVGRRPLQVGRARAGRALKTVRCTRASRATAASRPAARRILSLAVHRDMPVTNIATTAAAMVHVASQPSAFSRRVTVNGPITCGSSASSIITIMIGTAITPLITALQNSALIGSIGVKSSTTPPSVASAMIA